MSWMRTIGFLVSCCCWYVGSLAQASKKPYNVVFILSDDHRYDFMGFMDKVPDLETPNMDRMAREGAHLQNAFVSTALCSPSRASILTGQYAHTHTIVDTNAPMPRSEENTSELQSLMRISYAVFCLTKNKQTK